MELPLLLLLLFLSAKYVNAGIVFQPTDSRPGVDPTVAGGVGQGADVNLVAGRDQGLGFGLDGPGGVNAAGGLGASGVDATGTMDGGAGFGLDMGGAGGTMGSDAVGGTMGGGMTGGMLDGGAAGGGVGGGTMDGGSAGIVMNGPAEGFLGGGTGGMMDGGFGGSTGGLMDGGGGMVGDGTGGMMDGGIAATRPSGEVGIGAGTPIGVGADVGVGGGLGEMGGMGGVGSAAASLDPATAADAAAAELMISPEQRRINRRCRRECFGTENCFRPHELDCRLFYQCDRNAEMGYWGVEKPCPHGTFWSGSNEILAKSETTCALPQDVMCPNDPCLTPENDGGAYSHPNSCKQYWRCEGGISVAKCCPGYERYNKTTGECEYMPGAPCHPSDCPIIPGTCKNPNVQSEPMFDGICGSYWACRNGSPIPACCPPGERYNIRQQTCIRDPRAPCTDICDHGEGIVCLSDGQLNYLNDSYCSSYIMCVLNVETQTFMTERRCCRTDYVFDRMANKCVRSTMPPANCQTGCPTGYFTDCHLQPVEGVPDAYITESHGIQTTMPCGPGTVFSLAKCGCGTAVEGAADNSCAMQLDINFHWKKYVNYGSENMVNIQQIGSAAEGSVLNGQSTYKFNGSLIFKVDYFKQALPEFFFQIDYLPETRASNNRKVVLLSNCRQAAAANQRVGEPSFEVTLENGNVVLRARTPMDSVELKTPYEENNWNQVKMYYDKSNVLMSNQALSMKEPRFQTGPLNGAINQAMEGLEIGSCEEIRRDRMAPNYDGFTGDIHRVRASKCLSLEQKKYIMDRLPAVPMPLVNGQGQGFDMGSGPKGPM